MTSESQSKYLKLRQNIYHYIDALLNQNILSITVISYLIILSILSIINTFTYQITPDISVYLLHAKTFVEELNRFTLSHDSKGILLTFLLSLPVKLFGPNMIAAASIQLCAHIIGFVFLYFIIRSFASKPISLIVSLLGFCLIHSYHLWGGEVRPENFAMAFTLATLYAVLRNNHKWLMIGGAMTACCLFIKTTLVLTPFVVISSAILGNFIARDKINGRSFLQRIKLTLKGDIPASFLGFAFICLIVFGWVAVFDNLQGMFHQNIQ